jgi:hypothetical protein
MLVNSRRMIYVIFLVASLVCAPQALAEGWKVPNLNPFKKTSAKTNRAQASFTDHVKSAGMPKFSLPSWPGATKSKEKRSREPSTMQKLGRNTKAFFGKTKRVLMPWSTSKKPTGSRTPKKKSFFGSWWPGSKPKRQTPKTVTDFLGQERPGF